MSPEQVRGLAIDARSDIFSFGAILYEMLSGKRAFHGDTAADTMSSILKEDPPDLSATNRNVSPALERIVQHCLEKNPEAAFPLCQRHRLRPRTSLRNLRHYDNARNRGCNLRARAKICCCSPSPRGLALAVAAARSRLVAWAERRSSALSRIPADHISRRLHGKCPLYSRWQHRLQRRLGWWRRSALHCSRTDDPGARELGLKDAELLSISKNGELAMRLDSAVLTDYERTGTLARVPLSGGTPREVLDNVEDADWAANGENIAVIRRLPENGHWRLEYPIGKVLFDSINWISHLKNFARW